MESCLERSQGEYLELLETYEDRILQESSLVNVLGLLDEVDKFWRKRAGCVEKDIDALTESNTCMILSGAVYLDYAANDHYLYKSLGRCHLLHDSILKLEHIIRAPRWAFNHEPVSRLFLTVFQDELMVLRSARKHFFYVPLQLLMVKHSDDHQDLLSKGFWSVVSNLFEDNIESVDDFTKLYKNYSEIESALGKERVNTIIFNAEGDDILSIGERTEVYLNHEVGLGNLLEYKGESEKFLTVLRCHTCQVLDIILTATCFNITPYIRFQTTFYYFILIAQSFRDDKKLKSMIEKTIITYLFYHEADRDVFSEASFNEFSEKMMQQDYLSQIIAELRRSKIDITSGGLPELREIIHNVFPMCGKI
jgi:hypothetical protein